MSIPRPFACVFDAYGTLLDIETTIKRDLSFLEDRTESFATIWRTRQLEYTWLRTIIGHYADFWKVTLEALEYTMDCFELTDPLIRTKLIQVYLRLDAYSDAFEALSTLKKNNVKTVVLSNGTESMLMAVLNTNGLHEHIDTILSVDTVRVYKPHPEAYQLACDQLYCQKDQIVFISSNGWDVSGASSFGFHTVRLNRYNKPHDRLPGEAVAEIQNLNELYPLFDPPSS